jgi:toxin ParE1/3/4
MRATIFWTPEAREDILEIVKFISRDSPSRALDIAKNIEVRVADLAIFPHSGSPVREYPKASVREIILYNYRIIYLPSVNRIAIIGVIHGARRLRKAIRGRRKK